MGHPTTPFTLGIPLASSDGKFYARYPQGDKFSTVGNASGALASVVASTPDGSAGGSNILFFDDFSSGNFNKTMNGFSWMGGANVSVVDCTSFQRPGGSSKAVKFAYGNPLNDVAELDFQIGTPGYTHVFMRWWEYYPSGNESPSVGPAVRRTTTHNNKTFRLGDATPVASSPNHFGGSTYGNSNGDETFFFEWGGPGFYDQPGNGRGVTVPFITAARLGGWHKVEIEVKSPTVDPVSDPRPAYQPFGKADGIFRLWIDDVLVLEFTDAGQCPANMLMAYGYWRGSVEFGDYIVPQTNIYATDVAVSTAGRV
jgi:hypothetical protein